MKKITKVLAGFIVAFMLCCLVPFSAFAIDSNESVDSTDSTKDDAVIAAMIEGKQIWEDYLTAFSPLAEDEKTYEGLLRYVIRDDAAKLYAEITGQPKEEYIQMSALDKFLWTYTYLNIENYTKKISIKNYSTWLNSPIGNSRLIIKSNGGNQDMIDINNKFLEWSYNYYVATGKVYNFLEDFEDIEDVSEPEEESTTVSEHSSFIEAESSVPAESQEESVENTQDVSSEEKEEGIWDEVITYLNEHIFTIALLLILAIATLSVFLYRKNKTIDDK